MYCSNFTFAAHRSVHQNGSPNSKKSPRLSGPSEGSLDFMATTEVAQKRHGVFVFGQAMRRRRKETQKEITEPKAAKEETRSNANILRNLVFPCPLLVNTLWLKHFDKNIISTMISSNFKS